MGLVKYLDITNDLKLLKNLNEASIVIKFKSINNIGKMTIFSATQGNNSTRHITLIINDGKINASIITDNSTVNINSSDSYTDGLWHVLILTLSINGVTLNVDGTIIGKSNPKAIGTSFMFISNLSSVIIGKNSTDIQNEQDFFIGEIDYIDIFNRVLSNDEIGNITDTKVNINYTIPFIDLSLEVNKEIIVDKESDVSLAYPATVLLDDEKTMYAIYQKGLGELVLKKSIDRGITWSDRLPTPSSWLVSEIPTFYKVNKPDGTIRLLLILGIKSGNGGFKTAYSDDLGNTWSEFKTWFSIGKYFSVVAQTSLTRLKNDDGSWDNKWLGTFYDYSYNNWKSILSFDNNGNEVWTEPVRILQNYDDIEKQAKLCNIEMLRSPNGKQLALIACSDSKKNNAMIAFSNDEGETWSVPMEMQGALNGESHKAKYDPISDRLLISFREIIRDPNKVGDMTSWKYGHWCAWVGTYDDLVRNLEGQYRVKIMNNSQLDCGYGSNKALSDGTYILTSYGYWDNTYSNSYIVSISFKLKELDDMFKKNNPYKQNFNEVTVFDSVKDGYGVLNKPSIVTTFNGVILACCEAKQNNIDTSPSNILLKSSEDEGKTWSSASILVNGINSSEIIDNPLMIADEKNSLVHLLYCKNNSSSYYMKSLDNGLTWSKPIDITEVFNSFKSEYNWAAIAIGPGHGIQTKEGRLLVPVWLSLSKDHTQSVVTTIYSDDNGASWIRGEIINSPNVSNLREATLVQLENGSIMINMRNSVDKKRAISVSLDGVTSWCTPTLNNGLDDGECFGGMIRLTDGSSYYNSRLLFSNINNTSGRSNITIKMSMDEGVTWPITKTIYTGLAAYSDLAVNTNKSLIYCLYEKDGNNKLQLAKFNLEWITNNNQHLNSMEDTFRVIYPIVNDEFIINKLWNSLEGWTINGDNISITSDSKLLLNSNSQSNETITNTDINIDEYYTVEFKARLDDFVSGAFEANNTLGIKVLDGNFALVLDFRQEGVYSIIDNGQWTNIKGMTLDSNWHVWNVAVNSGKASLYMDNVFLNNFNLYSQYGNDMVQHWGKSESEDVGQAEEEYIKIYNNATTLNARLEGFFGSNNKHYFQNQYYAIISESNNKILNMTCWKGEKISAEIILWSDTEKIQDVKVKSSLLKDIKGNVITANNIYFNFLKYVKASGQMVPDILDNKISTDISPRSIQPIWITIEIPQEVNGGIYSGTIEVKGRNSNTLNFQMNIEVLDIRLPSVENWTFHLDLWQNPYAIARYYKVPVWSQRHIDYLKPHLKMLRKAGQKVITATIIKDPWNSQTYDAYDSMVAWRKQGNGIFKFNFTNFDTYVSLCLSIGIDDQINCYSMVPWNNRVIYFDEVQGKEVQEILTPGSYTWNNYWSQLINALVTHVTEKGWINKTYVAMDERPISDMQAVVNLLKNTPLKISGAMNYADVASIVNSINDMSMAIWQVNNDFYGIVESRRKLGLNTTYYVCTGAFPNTFTYSNPGEAAWMGWYASKFNANGFLRWAYDSWVEDPLVTTDFIRFESGDCLLVYPGARSSVRFERLIEGVQDSEKINYIFRNNSWNFEMNKILRELKGGSGDNSVNYGNEVLIARAKLNNIARNIISGKKSNITNISLNKVAIASSSEASYGRGPEKGVDGDLSTRWCANTGSANEWWQIDLGDRYNLNAIEILWEKSAKYGFIIQASLDGVAWKNIFENISNLQNQNEMFISVSVSPVRYVKVQMQSLPAGVYASFYEFKVFGSI